MSDFKAIKASEDVVEAIQRAPDEDDIMMEVKPPKNNGGIGETERMFRSFHQVEEEVGLFSRSYSSNTCGMEIWRDEDGIRFFYYVPNRVEERHYRRQMTGHFSGISIEEKQAQEEKFPDVSEGDYIASTRFSLNHHYFEPIRSSESKNDSISKDPYQTILSEIDTQGNTRTVLQVMYKPAPPNWTEVLFDNVESHAEKMKEKSRRRTRWFGLVVDEVDPPGHVSRSAKQVHEQINKQGFFVDVRLAVIDEDKKRAERHLNTLTNLFTTLYREPSGQHLVPNELTSETAVKQALVDMATRKEKNMTQGGFMRYLKMKLRGASDTMVFTISELAGLAHIPSGDQVSVDSLSWTDVPVEGTLPPEEERFKPLSEKERKEILQDDSRQTGAQEAWQPTSGESEASEGETEKEDDVWVEEELEPDWLPEASD